MVTSLESCQIFDISPEISPEIAVYPGDTPFSANFLLDMKEGHHLTLSSITSTVHLGAHADAPSHYHKEGESIESRSLHHYLGTVQVIEVDLGQRERIQPEHFESSIQAPRVLFKTNSFPNPKEWNDDFCALSEELIHFLHNKNVITVGLDTPSVDISDDKELLAHNAIAQYDMAILEGVILKDVPEGIYQLIALPLKIKGSDASPVRAILLKQN